MKRIGLGMAAVLLLVSGGWWATIHYAQNGTAQEERTIPINAIRFGNQPSELVRIGERCDWRSAERLYGSQFIVRDAANAIVAVWTIEGEYTDTPSGTLTCDARIDLTVPESTFYSVYLDDRRLTTYSASDFPIAPEAGISEIDANLD